MSGTDDNDRVTAPNGCIEPASIVSRTDNSESIAAMDLLRTLPVWLACVLHPS